MMELENQHLTTTIETIVSNKNNKWMLQFCEKQDLIQHQSVLSWGLLITKVKRITLQYRNLGPHHFNQVIKVRIISNGTNRQHMPPYMMHQEGKNRVTSVVTLAKYCISLIMCKCQKIHPAKYLVCPLLIHWDHEMKGT